MTGTFKEQEVRNMTDVLRKQQKDEKENLENFDEEQGKAGGEAEYDQDDLSSFEIDTNDLVDIDEDRRQR